MAQILVGDDSWLIRQMLTKILKKAGYEIIEAENGNQVIQKCMASKPDCIILDLLMPDRSGIDVMK